MNIKRLHLKNIRSYEQQTIEFPKGSLLLAGDVGSGKTTLLLAIEYALFGLQPGQKGSALLRNNTSSGEVILECEIDGNEICIERQIKREKKSVTSDYASITINAETRECSVTELKTKILQLLNYPPEFIKKNNVLYRYTVYTPQEQMKQIILEDAETRLNILRHVFGIDKYKRIRENLAVLLNRLKEETKLLQGELRTIEQDKSKKEEIISQIAILKGKIYEKEEACFVVTQKRKHLEGELMMLESKIKEKELLDREIEKAKIMISSKSESFAVLKRESLEIEKIIAETKEMFKENEYLACISALKSEQQHISQIHITHIEVSTKLSSLQNVKNENFTKKERVFFLKFCPTCLQDVPQAHKHNILNEIEVKLADMAKEEQLLTKEKEILNSQLEQHKKNLAQYEQEKSRYEILKAKTEYLEISLKKKEEIAKKLETFQKDIDLLMHHSSTLRSSLLRFSHFEIAHKKKSEELSQARNTEKNAEITVAELKKELELMQKEIKIIDGLLMAKELKAQSLAKLNTLIDWLSNYFTALISFTETQVLMKLRREFSTIFNTWFHMIAGESFEVQLDENFTPVIMQGDVEMDYGFLSGGERTAVALAYRLALNQTINSVFSQIKTRDIVILDEPTDGFSEAQIDKIRDVLNQLIVEQLIIVSHEQKIESFVDNIIRLKKEGDVSCLETSGNPL